MSERVWDVTEQLIDDKLDKVSEPDRDINKGSIPHTLIILAAANYFLILPQCLREASGGGESFTLILACPGNLQ